jgi:hypothetical protein
LADVGVDRVVFACAALPKQYPRIGSTWAHS